MNRRNLFRLGAGLGLSLTGLGRVHAASNQAQDPRFVLVILRGGMDGLSAVPPYADSAYAKLRGRLALAEPARDDGALDLDGSFGLHPSLRNLHSMFGARELSIVHAIAPPYRERSHFDGQDVLEAGVPNPSGSATGWLYRALELAPNANDHQYAYALGNSVPLVLRGAKPVGAWSPDRLPDPDENTLARLTALYEEDDVLGPMLAASFESEEIAGQMSGAQGGNQMNVVAAAAAKFLTSDGGPRIAVLESGGWDTHANQGAATGQLANRLRALDGVLGQFRTDMGAAWSQTVVAVVTEFGRTVRINGTRGSDHGYGSAAFLLGGAVAGGRMLGEWPGLRLGNLFEGRDLMATSDMRALFAGVLVDHLGVADNAVQEVVFPGYPDRMPELIRG